MADHPGIVDTLNKFSCTFNLSSVFIYFLFVLESNLSAIFVGIYLIQRRPK